MATDHQQGSLEYETRFRIIQRDPNQPPEIYFEPAYLLSPDCASLELRLGLSCLLHSFIGRRSFVSTFFPLY